MSFIRPELAQRLNRWRETLAGAAAAAFGCFWMITESGALLIIGIVLTVGGALLIFAGIQRARFRRGIGGPGVVQVDEGQLTYFGPVEGGTVAVDSLTRLRLDPTPQPSARWILSHPAGEDLAIPVDAAGADALFDVFAGLPGIRTEAMLEQLNRQPDTPVVIWERDTAPAD